MSLMYTLSLRWNWNVLMKNVTHRSDDSSKKNVEIQSTALLLPATALSLLSNAKSVQSCLCCKVLENFMAQLSIFYRSALLPLL